MFDNSVDTEDCIHPHHLILDQYPELVLNEVVDDSREVILFNMIDEREPTAGKELFTKVLDVLKKYEFFERVESMLNPEEIVEIEFETDTLTFAMDVDPDDEFTLNFHSINLNEGEADEAFKEVMELVKLEQSYFDMDDVKWGKITDLCFSETYILIVQAAQVEYLN